MTKIELRLDHLQCRVQGDASGGSEPYLWPVLLWVTDQTLGTATPVRVNHPHSPRTVIAQNVHAGAALAVPASVGRISTNLDAGDSLRKAIAVVTLLENDDTPDHVVLAAYDRYVEALPVAIAGHLLELNSDDPDTVDAATAAVREEVSDAVHSAGKDALTWWEKVKVEVGSLNLDDEVGAEFASTEVTKELGLTFQQSTTILSQTVVTQDWRLSGALVVDNTVDRCASEALAVNRAKVVRDAAQRRLRDLQTAFAQAPAAERPAIQLDIDDARAELSSAESALDAAESALAACRARPPRHIPEHVLDHVLDHVIEVRHDLT
ncbi:hypothetical protein SAMN04489867_0065 [Pedococcus dokdonensis]|uniref:Uncharacterized protein n=1 Tax=Pedococcus dokdonensis TaxID=443156 RepID=A0A1H0KP38_9MICO|nr:hypothetical protein [Pedococcus dokdonensis]SDO57553.1 hypothetical protein SAMN04489867_0065 [Pedococcus dokdonensis]